MKVHSPQYELPGAEIAFNLAGETSLAGDWHPSDAQTLTIDGQGQMFLFAEASDKTKDGDK